MSSLSSPSWLSRIDLTPFTTGVGAVQTEFGTILGEFQRLADSFSIGLVPVHVTDEKMAFTGDPMISFGLSRPYDYESVFTLPFTPESQDELIGLGYTCEGFKNGILHDPLIAERLSKTADALEEKGMLVEAGAAYFISAFWSVIDPFSGNSFGNAPYLTRNSCHHLDKCMSNWQRALNGESKNTAAEVGIKLPEDFSGISALQNRLLSLLYFLTGMDYVGSMFQEASAPLLEIPGGINPEQFERTILQGLKDFKMPTEPSEVFAFKERVNAAFNFCCTIVARLVESGSTRDQKKSIPWQKHANTLEQMLDKISQSEEKCIDQLLERSGVEIYSSLSDFHQNVILNLEPLPDTQEELLARRELVKLIIQKVEYGSYLNQDRGDCRRSHTALHYILLRIDRQLALVAKRDRG